MKFREICTLLPCHSLEDFPLYHTGDDADSLLACWTALWHPALLASANSPPKWHRVDLPPEDLTDQLILVPTVAVAQLPTGFGQRAKEAGALLLRGERDRSSILAAALSRLDGGTDLDSELVADFLALGFAYLQVQILTRQMRYASNLDEVHFFSQLLAAAQAANTHQHEESRAKLSACFDLLGEERDHYYSVDAYLIDMTLVAEQTIGAALRAEFAGNTPINLLISGEVAQSMRDREPASSQAVVQALREGGAGLIGGEYREEPLPLLPCEDILAELRHGLAVVQECLGKRIEVYGRRRFGLTPYLPTVLEKLRFHGALHATLDDGHFPAGGQVKTRWQGLDSSVVDAIAKPPLDASKPETFLSYAQKLGESMDSDHVATLCLAHWPGLACTWYADLKRCARFTAALGKFITVERYFADTYQPGHLERFPVDQYKSPYLRQAVIRKQPDPISSVVVRWQQRLVRDTTGTLATLAAAVSPPSPAADVAETIVTDAAPDVASSVARFADRLPREPTPTQPGYLVMNPCGFSRRIGVDVSELSTLPEAAPPVFSAGESQGCKVAVVDLPPMGFAWVVGSTKGTAPPKSPQSPQLAVDERQREGVIKLRNEFLEASFNPVTGALQILRDYQTRGNRLSQQLALRTPSPRGTPPETGRDPEESANYSVMAADEIRIVASSTAYGELLTRGRLLRRDGQVVASFRQQWRLWRGSRVLQLDLELEPAVEPTSDPWNSYYACRFAWADETAELYQSLNQCRQRVSKSRIESSLFLELESGDRRTTLLTGGLPYHRRVGSRMLDSLLVVRGESARRFRLGIGVDLSQPLPEALGLLMPSTVLYQTAPPPRPSTCWLFHIDARSVVPTHWSLIHEGPQLVGVRTRLLESSGRQVRAKLSAFRPFISARQVNFLGETLCELSVNGGQAAVELNAHEWAEVEARWS